MNTLRATSIVALDIFNAVNVGLIVVDSDLKILLWNNWMVKHSNIEERVVLNMSLLSIFSEPLAPTFLTAVKNALAYRLPVVLSTALHRTPLPLFNNKLSQSQPASRIHQSITITPLGERNTPVSCLIQIVDSSPSVKREKILHAHSETLKQQAITDPMTGICNRRFFDEHYWMIVAEAKRQKHPISVLMVDIDYFKPYNDYYGHVQGDQVIRLVANTLKSHLSRATDIAVRYGGEEFVLILPHISMQQAELFAEKLTAAVYRLSIPHAKSEVSDYLTISIGVCTGIPSKDGDLLACADKALYQAKSRGRNQYFSVDTDLKSIEIF